jgi:ribosomal protein L18E
VHAHAFSAAARQTIEAAGGTCQLVVEQTPAAAKPAPAAKSAKTPEDDAGR